jgi:DNA-directed RNA polymerase specialized sigma24 family protein
MEPGSGQELLKRIAEGDRSAFAEYVEGTAPVVYGLVSRILGNASAVDEVVLEVYTEAWRTAGTFNPERATPIQWIAAIARARAVVRRFEASAANVPLGSLAIDPPDHLRDLILLRLEQEPDTPPPIEPPSPPALPPSTGHVEAQPPEARPPTPPPVPKLVPPPRDSSTTILPWVIAVLLLGAAGLSYFRWKQADDNNSQLQRMVEAAQGDAQQLRSMLELERGRTRELEQLSTAISTAGSRTIHLIGRGTASTVSAAIFWDVQNGQWTVTGHLPPPPEGKNYYLWFVSEAGRVKAGELKAGADGHVFAVLAVPENVDKITGAVVSLESDGGASQPTAPYEALGRLLP